MVPQPWRWAIVGTGHMAATMAITLARNPAAAVLAVASRSPARAAAFAQERDIPHAGKLDEVLARPDIDICYIATPPAQHHAHCLAALAAGHHVLCEKPLAIDAAQARDIAAAAARHGRFCMEAMWTLCLPAIEAAARSLADGAIGTPTLLAASFGLPTASGDPALAVGALLDRGCYPIALALRLFGTPSRVGGVVTCAGDVDQDATILLDFRGGARAVLGCSLTGYLVNDAVIAGTRGRLTLQEPITSPNLITLARATPGPAAAPSPPSKLRHPTRALPLLGLARRLRATHSHGYGVDGYAPMITEVHRCLSAGHLHSDLMPLDRSIATLDVIDRVRRSREGAW